MFHPIELVQEWETRRNSFLRATPNAEEFSALWTVTERSGLPAMFAAWQKPPQLMVVLTTFGRPQGAAAVLRQLGKALESSNLTDETALLVLHDACTSDYSVPRDAAHIACPRIVWLDARQHLGKSGFWRMHQTALLAAKAWQPERTLYLQDDLVFGPELLQEADRIWNATAVDPRRRVLYLFSSNDDEENGRWIRSSRRDLPHLRCRQTNWFDLQAFLVDRAFHELLDYRMVPIHPNRWRRKPDMSSGVGRQLTLRAFGRATVYQAYPPLVHHGALPSIMNTEARSRRSLNNLSE